ncbi:MAG: HesA/MoeB/ThiF family protein [Methanobacteriota archaeon]|nr:MAG: HesA/MoeB/ThiF family protein [Euryarchaeota archaeon]
MGLSLNEIKRYSRQLVLPDMGAREQNRLKNAKVAVTGAGGLGCPVSTYLTLAGVGQIDIFDMDKVELSNFNRQFLYTPEDIGRPKVEVAAERLRAVNPEIEVNAIDTVINYDNAFDLLKGYDAVVDGTDNFPVRYAVNDACVVNRIPLFHGAVLMYEGRVTTIIPGETACYRCAFPEPPPAGSVPTCREAGVFGAMTGIVGSIQSLEAIRYLAGLEPSLKNTLLIINADYSIYDRIKLRRREGCSACGETFIPRPVDYSCEVPEG